MERPVERTKEQFYQRRIAELEKQVAELLDQVAKLTQQVATLSKNSSNSSKPPSSDIVKPPKPNNPKGPRRQGGQPGHKGVTRSPFRLGQIDRVEELHPTRCLHGHDGKLEPTGQAKVQQVAELRENPLEITEYRLHACRCSTC